jgi:hypothetical protein
MFARRQKTRKFSSVGDPDPQDPPVFGLRGFVSQRDGSGSFRFLIQVLSGLKYCLQNKILAQNLSLKQ